MINNNRTNTNSRYFPGRLYRSNHNTDTVAVTVAALQAVTAHLALDGTATEEDTTLTDLTQTT